MKQLAEVLDVSDAAVSKWENGQAVPKFTYIIKLANFFNVSTDYIAGLEDDFGTRVGDGGAASDLTAEERQLVADFRSLSPGLKDMIKKTMDIYTKRTTIDVQ